MICKASLRFGKVFAILSLTLDAYEQCFLTSARPNISVSPLSGGSHPGIAHSLQNVILPKDTGTV